MRSISSKEQRSQGDARLARELLDRIHAQRRRLRWRSFAFYQWFIAQAAFWPAADIELLLARTYRTFGVRKPTAKADLAVARAAIAEQPAVNVRLRTRRRDLDCLLALAREAVQS